MKTTTIIGLEVHVQLMTESKLFCEDVNLFNPDNPNVQTCPLSLGLPGTLPVLNRKAMHLGVKGALGLNCNIAAFTKWDRKHYYYPDLPKGYQISQYDLPFSYDGWLDVETESLGKRRIGIIRAHLEDDAGKNIHDETGRGDSQVDLNRAGTPLIEIVSEPDIRTAEEARLYLEEVKRIMTYLEVSDCNMQEGSLRCDANVNLHIETDDGEKIATPIVEIKNLNSFRGVEAAIEYEESRQLREWEKTGHTIKTLEKRTFGWDANKNVTFPQREKEEASDYRYIPDPDLIPVTMTDADIDAVRSEMCELPPAKRQRLLDDYELSSYDANVIVDQGPKFGDYFEEVTKLCGNGKQACNWVTQDALREMNDRGVSIDDFPIRPTELGHLLNKINGNVITIKSAREVFVDLLEGADDGAEISSDRIDQIIVDKDLEIVSDTGELDAIISDVIAKNEKAAEDFRGGKQAAIGALIGQVMRNLKGADPKQVREMLIEKITNG
ncbi:MAG: Asp-tRNA(Asn)/Glu-tRNA(Gln) amidotransferase GatCAB subunit B [Planctomycetaceae bacterium]|nr:Asp-tRNA(Asn)/Glu-tRNA(Gln) amidotransferase GatCAB subunit B [Planctomycetaceae bacterium]